MITIIKDIFLGTASLLFIYLSLYGIGSILFTTIKIKDDEKYYLLPAVGISIYTYLGGWLDLLHLGGTISLLSISLIGVLIGIIKFTGDYKFPIKNNIALTKNQLITFILFSYFIIAIGTISPNFHDDNLGYYPNCLQLLSTGSSFEPFGFRRALSLGGQYPLQSVIISICGTDGGLIYNLSLGVLLLSIIILLKLKKHPFGYASTLLIACGLIFVPIGDINSAPGVIICTLLICAFYTKNLFIKNLLFATCLSMRAQSAPFIITLLLSKFILDTNQDGIKKSIRKLSTTFIIFSLYLLPFFINNYQQFGVLIALGLHLNFLKTIGLPDFLNHGSVKEAYTSVSGTITENLFSVLRAVVLLISVVWLALRCLKWREVRSIAIASIITIIIIALGTSKLKLIGLRYIWPYTSAASIFLILYILKNKPNLKWAPILICIYLVFTLPCNIIYAHYDNLNQNFNSPNIEEKKDIQEAQASTTIKKTIAMFSLYPLVMDYKRNKIYNMDIFPSTGNIPDNSNINEWKNWANKYKIDYLITPKVDWEHTTPLETSEEKTKESWESRNVWWPNLFKELKIVEELIKKMPADNIIKNNSYNIIKLD